MAYKFIIYHSSSLYSLLTLKMIKISNETRIGIFATVAIALSIWGYKFLKGEGVIDRSLTLYTKVRDAKQINKSSPIYYKGIQIGAVKDFLFDPKDAEHVTLILKLKQNPGIPKNARAVLFANGALGGEAMMIEFAQICSGGDCAVNEDFLQGESKSPLENFLGKPGEMDVYLDKATKSLNSVFDTLSGSLKNPDNEVGKSLRDVQATLINLRLTTAALNKMMVASSGSLNATMQNMQSITDNLKANNDKIGTMLTNVNDVTSKATTIDFSKINKASDGIGQSIEELKKTLTETQNSLAQVSTTFKKVNGGEGTIGQFATNDSVYHSLNLTLMQTQALMQDVRLNPKRYINLNPFRKHKDYKVPSQDPLMDTLQKRFNSVQKH
jgi:phospholipid/cholesterol/gamma-HCH transport system substrate-binding protein